MKVTPEMMAKFEQCKSPDDLMELVKQEKISLTTEQAQKLFDLFQSEDVTDEKMEKVFGGETTLSTIAGIRTHCGAEYFDDGAGIGGGGKKGGAIYN